VRGKGHRFGDEEKSRPEGKKFVSPIKLTKPRGRGMGRTKTEGREKPCYGLEIKSLGLGELVMSVRG